jgi:hypothetical protein
MVIASAVQLGHLRTAAVAVALVVVLAIVPVALLMFRQVKRGRWRNVDASNVHERPPLFIVSSIGLIVLVGYLLLAQPQSFLLRGVFGVLAMVAVSAAITRWVKLSLHQAFATLAATVLLLLGSPVGWVLLLALPALAWSRLVLARHTPLELLLGSVVGAVCGLGIHFSSP